MRRFARTDAPGLDDAIVERGWARTRPRPARKWRAAGASRGDKRARARAPGLDPSAAVGRRRNGFWAAPAQICEGHAQEDAPRRLAQRLRSRRRAGQVVVVDGLAMEAPKTKQAISLLKALGVDGQRVLVIVAERDVAVERSFSNLPDAKTLLSGYLNVRDLLGYDTVVFAKEAVQPVENWLAVEAKAEGEVMQEGAVAVAAEAGEE